MTLGTALLLGTGTAGGPSGDVVVDFAQGLPSGASVAHNGNCVYRQSNGKFKIASANEARLDYDDQGQFVGLVLEKAYTNLHQARNYSPLPFSEWQAINQVNDAAALAAAGLDEIQSDDEVIEAAGNAQLTATPSNPGELFSICAFVRNAVGGGNAGIQLAGVGNVNTTGQDYTVLRSPGIVQTFSGARLRYKNLSGGIARGFGATLVVGSTAPLYPILGDEATKNEEVLSIPDSVIPDGTYDIVFDTGDGGSVNVVSVVVSGGYTIQGSDLPGLGFPANVVRIKKITFTGAGTTPPPPPPPTPSTLRFPLGFGMLGGANDSGVFPQNARDKMDDEVRVVMGRLNHIDIEPQRGVYDFSNSDNLVALAEEKAAETGVDYSAVIFFQMRPFGSQQDSPFTSTTSWILNNPEEFGGIVKTFEGQTRQWGGLWESAVDANRWTTVRYEPAFDTVQKNLAKAFIQRYRNNPRVRGICFPESALGVNGLNSDTPFQSLGGGDGYFDRTIQWMEEAIEEEDPPFPVFHGSTFWHGARGSNRAASEEYVRLANQFNASRGKEQHGLWWPDSRSGSRSNLAWYLGYEDAHAAGFSCPMIASLQTSSYSESSGSGAIYTLDDVTEDMHNRFELLTAWAGGNHSRFDELKGVVQASTDPRVVAWRDRTVWPGSDVNLP